MQLEENKNEELCTLKVDGKIDSNTSKTFEDKISQLLEKQEKKLLIDFSLVNYISSSGLRVLLSSVKKMKDLNGKIALLQPNDFIKNTIDVSGFASIIPYFIETDKANEYLNEEKKE